MNFGIQLKKRGFFYTLFVLAFAILLICNIFIVWELQDRNKALEWVTHTYQVRENLQTLLLNIANIQIHVASSFKSKDNLFDTDHLKVQNNLLNLKAMTADNAEQQKRLNQLDPLLRTFFALLLKQQFSESSDFRSQINQIEKIIKDMDEEEINLLKIRKQISEQKQYKNFISIVVSTAIGYKFLILSFIAIIALTKKNDEQQKSLLNIEKEKLELHKFLSDKLNFSLVAAQIGDWDLNLETHTSERSLLHDQIFGYNSPLTDWTYEMFLDHVHPEDRDMVDLKFKEANEKEIPWEFQCRIYRADDKTLHWIWAKGKIVTIGQTKHMLGLVQDITDRISAEKEIEQYAIKLEKSNNELQQFAYIASHDLQAPLRVITSYLQLIERRYKDTLEKDIKDFIDFAVNAAQRLQNMIDGLLLYSRVETQGKPFENVDCESVLKQTLDNLKFVIEENKAEITHDSLPIIHADEMQMIQLFQNLISNAIKFHAEETPKIHISASNNKTEWLFSIQDNGIGIPPEFTERIFNMFEHLAGPKYPGSGIGLAVCERIVKRHNGTIWVESEAGKGSVFYFTIPI